MATNILEAGREPVRAREELKWRRCLVLRGPMPIEIRRGQTVVGRLRSVDILGTRYRAEIGSGSWVFSRSFRQRRCAAHHESSGFLVAKAERTGFRRKRVELASGPPLEWRQRGWAGTRYEMGRMDDGPVLLTALNTGGQLRWSGRVVLEDQAIESAEGGGFLLLFGVFLVFNSWELHFG